MEANAAADTAVSAAAEVIETVVPEPVWKVVLEFFSTTLGHVVGQVLLVTITLLVTVLVVKFTNRAFNRMVESMKQTNKSGATLAAFLRYLVLFAIYFAAIAIIVSGIPMLNSAITKLMAAGGVLAVVFGVASQEALGSVASGMMILAFKPFVIGDVVNIISQGVAGTVEDITLRHTILRTLENKRIIIPNSTMNTAIIENFDYGEKCVCLTMDVGITYESDLERAMERLTQLVGAHPNFLDVRTEEDKEKNVPLVTVRVAELASSAVVLRAWLWGKDNASAVVMRADLLRQVKADFGAQGIDLAYPHLVVMNK